MILSKKLIFLAFALQVFNFSSPSFAMDAPEPGESPAARAKKSEETERARHTFDESQSRTNASEKPEVKIKGDPKITINNVRNPIFFSDSLHRAGADEKDEDYAAHREGELQAKKQAGFNNHFAELSSSPEALEQKTKSFRAQAQLAGAQRAANIEFARSDEGKRLTQAEIDVALFKREEMRKAIPIQQRMNDAEEDAQVEMAAKKHAELIMFLHKTQPNTIHHDMRLAEHRGTMSAATELAAKLYLRNNDPDQTLRGRFILLAQEAAIRLAIATAIDAAKQGGSLIASKAYEGFLKLPFAYCRNLKEQEEMFRTFKALQAKHQMNEQEKVKIQKMLQADTNLLNDHWREIQRIKGLINQATDPKEKEQLKEVHDALTQNYIESVLKKSASLQLNFDTQPQMSRLISAARQRQKQQKAAEKAKAS